MNKISNSFYNFLKISVTVALVLLCISSIGFLFFIPFTPMQGNLLVLLSVAAMLCAGIIRIKIKTNYKIVFILTVAFFVRLIWTLNVNSILVSDYYRIYDAANKFLNGNKEAVQDFGYLARFPHLVPMMVYMMGMLKLFGNNAFLVMKGVSLILSVLTVYLVYRLSFYYVKKPCFRLIAMAIAAVYPSFIAYSSTFCTETIGVPLFLTAVLYFHKCNEQEYTKKFGFLLCGVILYCSNLFRGVGLAFLIAFTLYIFLFSNVQTRKKLQRFFQLAIGYIVTAALISTVLIATHITERPLWKGSEPGYASLLLKGSNFETGGRWSQEDEDFVVTNLGNENLGSECLRIAGQRISERSFPEIVTFYGSKFFTQWSLGDCSGTYWATVDTNIAFTAAVPVPFQLIFVLVLLPSVFIFRSKREDNSSLALLLILLSGFGILFTVIETQGRYSYIVHWIFILLAVVGLENFLSEKKPLIAHKQNP